MRTNVAFFGGRAIGKLAAFEPPPSVKASTTMSAVIRGLIATDRAAVMPNAMVYLPHCPALGVRERTTQREIDRICTYVGGATVESDQSDFRYSTTSTRWASVNPRLSSFESL